MKKFLVTLVFLFAIVNITKAQGCKCNDKNGWNELAIVLNKQTKATTCGSTFNIKKTDKFSVKGAYKCIGVCDVVLKGSIYISTGFREDFTSISLAGVPLTFQGQVNINLLSLLFAIKKNVPFV